jgi:hypothetical protein
MLGWPNFIKWYGDRIPASELAKKYPFLASWDPDRVFYVDDTGDRGENDLLQRLVIPSFRAVLGPEADSTSGIRSAGIIAARQDQ